MECLPSASSPSSSPPRGTNACARACDNSQCTCVDTNRTRLTCFRCCGCTHVSSPLPVQSVWRDRANGTHILPRSVGASGAIVFAARRLGITRLAASGPTRQLVRLSTQHLNKTGEGLEPVFVAKARVLARLVGACELEWLYTRPELVRLRSEIPDGSGRFVETPHGVLLNEASGTSIWSFRRS